MQKCGKIARKDEITGLIFAMPSFLIITLFFFIPVCLSLRYSLTDWNGISANPSFIGIENFIDLFNEKNFFVVLLNTIFLMLLYVPVLNALSLLMSLFIFNSGKTLGNVCKSILFFPNLLSMVVVGFIWKIIFNYESGLLNQIFRKLGFQFLVQDWLGNINLVLPSISMSIIWFAIGYFTTIYVSGLASIPQELYEACKVEGANNQQIFFRITLPLLAPSITINIVLSSIGIISTFDLPFVMTNGGPGYASETIAMMIYHYAFSTLQQGYSLALSIILMFIAIIIAYVEFKLLRKREIEW